MSYPIVFVPGLLGSMGNDILPGTGKFDFGLAEYAYKPIIENLKSMGYRLDKDLFIAFYDWRKDNQDSGENYLIPIIEKAKEKTGSEKVNLICHSMGGLVARSYIQSDVYQYDVEKLIMIGTPNAGAARAYLFWEGGQIPYEEVGNNILFRFLWEGYIWIYRKIYGIDNKLNTLQKIFPSIKQLLPSNEYGSYLYTNTIDDFLEFIPINVMKVQNDFLNSLNQNLYKIYRREIKVYLIVGEGFKTEKYYYVEGGNSPYWIDGKPIYTVNTLRGDGTVTNHSCNAVYGVTSYIEGDHIDILKRSKYVLGSILNKRVQGLRNERNYLSLSRFHMILAKGVKRINISKNNKVINIKDNKTFNKSKIIIKEVNNDSFWILIDSEYYEGIELEFIPLENEKSDILILKGDKYKELNEKKEIRKTSEYILKIE